MCGNGIMLKKSDEKFIFKVIIFIFIAIIIAVKIDTIVAFISDFLKLLAPLFLGIVIALLLNRPTEYLKVQFRKIPKLNNEKAKIPSVIISYMLFLGVIVGLFLIIIPQLTDSFTEFVSNFEKYSETFNYTISRFSHWVEQYNIDPNIISKLGDDSLEFIENIVRALPNILSRFVSGTVSVVATFFMGLIISIYLLADKKRLKRQFFRVMSAITPESKHARFSHLITVVQLTFSNYLYIQLTEGLILGLLFFIATSLLGFPFALIISVLNGLSVLIPIVGAWLGAIGGGIVVVFSKPESLLLYVILVIVMQIIENNLIYPRRVNEAVGLPAMWVLVAVTVGGGLLGILGALLAVPVASVIYQVIAEVVERKEQKRRISASEKLQESSWKTSQMDSENIQEEMPIQDEKMQ